MRRSLCWEVLTQQNPKSHLRSLSLKPIRHTGMQSQLWLFSIKVLTDITTRIHRCFLYDLDLAKIKSMQTMRVKVLETASKRKKKEKRIIHKVEVQNGISLISKTTREAVEIIQYGCFLPLNMALRYPEFWGMTIFR